MTLELQPLHALDRVEELVAAMTLEEELAQLVGLWESRSSAGWWRAPAWASPRWCTRRA
ncbi:MAG: Beta-glucosidase [uncultured Quadrisphaera sp.]|uniref:Beta-glucosidase n=1 Tax=uncultured Quadrisphaera sp. TaxID=904978 RepID=A0A6J4QIE3_9ACTN|nr:MAG: Beta-glucosidase [uncultured Quadrisphaera sp.]